MAKEKAAELGLESELNEILNLNINSFENQSTNSYTPEEL
jgi:hypothetical protein